MLSCESQRKIIAAFGNNLKDQVCAKKFGGLMLFKPHSLDKLLLSWLMRKLNLEIIKLEFGGGKVIALTEHSLWCVFQISNVGSDPPYMTDDEARLKRSWECKYVPAHITPSWVSRF